MIAVKARRFELVIRDVVFLLNKNVVRRGLDDSALSPLPPCPEASFLLPTKPVWMLEALHGGLTVGRLAR